LASSYADDVGHSSAFQEKTEVVAEMVWDPGLDSQGRLDGCKGLDLDDKTSLDQGHQLVLATDIFPKQNAFYEHVAGTRAQLSTLRHGIKVINWRNSWQAQMT